MNKHIFQWKSVPNAGVKWRAGNIGVTQVFRKGFWVPTPQEVHCTHTVQQLGATNKQYLRWADVGDWTPLHMAD